MNRTVSFILVLPGMLLLLALMIVPALSVLPIAVTNWEFGKLSVAITGWSNFVELAGDPRFRAALANTLVYSAIVVPATVSLGLILAMLIDGGGRLQSLYRSAHFLPVVATLAAMAVAWEAILHPTFGLLNHILNWFGLAGRNWLRDEATVLPTLIAIGIWHNIGFAVVMFLAALRTVPSDLLDAATIDGAVGPLDRARVVILPVVAPITLFVSVVTVKKALSVYDTVAVLTQGGPGTSSEVLLHMLYVESFEQLRAGYGAAITVIYLILLFGVTYAQRVIDRKVHYA